MDDPAVNAKATRTRLPPAKRRALIMRAAASGFAADGYDGTTIDQVAEAAGVTKPMVYRHFASKKALYLELLRKHREDLPSFLAGVDLGETNDFEAQLRAILEGWFGYVALNSHAWEMLFRDRGGDEEIRAFRREVSARAREVMAAFVAAGPAGIPVDQVTPTAELLRSGLAGLALFSIDNPDVPRGLLVDVALRMTKPAFEPLDAATDA